MRAHLVFTALLLSAVQQAPAAASIREALVRRHAPTLTMLDVEAP